MTILFCLCLLHPPVFILWVYYVRPIPMRKESEDQLDTIKRELSYKHLTYRINRRNVSFNKKFMISILTK